MAQGYKCVTVNVTGYGFPGSLYLSYFAREKHINNNLYGEKTCNFLLYRLTNSLFFLYQRQQILVSYILYNLDNVNTQNKYLKCCAKYQSLGEAQINCVIHTKRLCIYLIQLFNCYLNLKPN